MRFPKPSFDALVASYETDPESVHDCPHIHTRNPINVNTCAIRMGEALVLANGLVGSRDEIAALRGNGRALLLGAYGYRASLCPHGISRGAGDVAEFLREQWGSPLLTWTAQATRDGASADAFGLRGVISFIGIPTFREGQGHIDLWNGDAPVGHQYWDAAKISLWKVE
jgi:hypothetical protein